MKNLISSRNKDFDRVDSDDDCKDILRSSSPHSSKPIKRRQKRNKNKYLNENLIINNSNNEINIINDNNSTDSVGLITSSISSSDIDNKYNENVQRSSQQRQQEGGLAAMANHRASISQRSIHGQTRTSHAFWNLCKCYVGAASFALPWAVSKTGIIPAIFGFILLSSLAYLTFKWMLISSHYAKQNCNPTYPELAEIAFNNFFPLFKKTKNNSTIDNKRNNDDNNNNNIDQFIEMQPERERMINSTEEIEMTATTTTIHDENNNNNIDKELYDTMNNNKYIKYNYRCGKIGKYLVYISMFLGMIGACGSYILFISGVIQTWLNPLISSETSLSFYLSILILIPFPICLSLLRSYSFLSSTAKFGVAGVVLALIVTIFDGILHIYDGTVNTNVMNNNLLFFDISGFPIFVGNACFLFVIHAMILSQEQSMIDRSRDRVSLQFKKANNLSLLLVTIINMLFAIFAYISFIDIVPFPDNIVDGLDHGIIQQITRACLCIDLLFTYALIMYPFTEALDSELFDSSQLNQNRNIIFKGNIIRILIVIITAGIAIGIPHFGYLTGLTGGSASIFLGFILPPIFIWRLAPDKIHWTELYILCPIIFIFGCVMFILSPYLILSQMYQS